MTIAFASGKGGTGKTTFSTAFAMSQEGSICFLDCDVEEPDSRFYIKPDISSVEKVMLPFPVCDNDKCSSCGRCANACRFSAVVMLAKKPLFFHELCHSCGGCMVSCQENAISEEMKQAGVISCGRKENIKFYEGLLDVGNSKSPPLIREVKARGRNEELVIIDSPPGATCPMVTSVRDADYIVLVTEPSPFALHDLRIAASALRQLDKPFGVIINKSGIAFEETSSWCAGESIPVLLEVPYTMEAAMALSGGILLTDVMPDLKGKIREITGNIRLALRESKPADNFSEKEKQ